MSLRRSNVIFNHESFLQSIDKLDLQNEKITFSKTVSKATFGNSSMTYKKPEYKGIKKEFLSGTSHPLMIKEGSNIRDILESNKIRQIQTGKQEMNFN